MICVLTCRLKPGAYDDFQAAWLGATGNGRRCEQMESGLHDT